MSDDTARHHRRSIRLRGYDYTQAGANFITIVTSNRQSFVGNVANGEMRLNEIGTLARDCWLAIPAHHPHADLDEFVIMPNHVHGVIVIENDPNADVIRRGVQLNAPTNDIKPRDPNNPFSVMSPHRRSLGVIIRTFKGAVTTMCRSLNRYDFGWQRNYYEHIIRNEFDLERIREYIFNNPRNWQTDVENAIRGDGRGNL